MLDTGRKRGAIKWWAGVVGGLFLLCVVVPLGRIKLTENRVFSEMTPEQRVGFERWLNAPVVVPPEAFDVSPFAEETVNIQLAVYEIFEQLDKAMAKRYEEAIDEALSEKPPTPLPTPITQDLEPLRVAFERAVLHPEYE